jgi:F-type H+-transporting ATPase subunit b
MDLVTPDIGLLFWMLVSFTIVLILLRKYAWNPILKGLKDREESIDNALKQAEQARSEMSNLQSDNEKLLKEARIERDSILKEARGMRDSIVNEAKNKAKTEGEKQIANARLEIENQKQAALADIKSQVAVLSLEIAEKVIREKFDNDEKHQSLVSTMINDVKLN